MNNNAIRIRQRRRQGDTRQPSSKLLPLLDKVVETAPGQWKACCPAHDDKRPSLSIKELDDGKLLIHDFGGCGGAEVVAAVGLTLADLYPERIQHNGRPLTHRQRRRYGIAADALDALANDALVVVIAAEYLAENCPLAEPDLQLVREAELRIRNGYAVAGRSLPVRGGVRHGK